jgi:O-antigen/teichoic acid export membrane protein
MIIAMGKQKALAKIYGFGALLNFSVNLFLIPRFSYWGAASSTLLTEAVVTLLMAVVIKKAMNYLPSFTLLFKTILAALTMVLALWLLGGLNLFVLLIVGSFVYFGALLGLRAFSVAELWALVGRGQRVD